jgi:hypothetical protein
MPLVRPIFIRLIGIQQLLQWKPSSTKAPIGELYQYLNAYRPVDSIDEIELADEATGHPVDHTTTVSWLEGRVLIEAPEHMVRARRQLEDFSSQMGSLFRYQLLAHSCSVLMTLRSPGMVRYPSKSGYSFFLRGKHEILMLLPKSFPEKAPTVIWLTPVFHPDLRAQEPAWPPGFSWDASPSVSMLLIAFLETLVGMRVSKRKTFIPTRPLVRNAEAYDWYRKHKGGMSEFARSRGYSLEERYNSLPLVKGSGQWRVVANLNGGEPLVFLSQRVIPGLREITRFGPCWMIGERGSWQGCSWTYVDRTVPYYGNGPIPATSVGFARQDGTAGDLQWRRPHDPLIAISENGEYNFRLGRKSDNISGYFLRGDCEPNADPWRLTTTTQSLPVSSQSQSLCNGPSDGLIIGQMEPLLCSYCFETFADGEFHECSQCGGPLHPECYRQIDGCPRMSCEDSPLHEFRP